MAAATADQLVETPESKPTFLQTQMGKNFLLGAAIASVVAIMAAVWLWSQQPDYKVLFSNFSDRDGGAITASLDQMAIPYKFSEGGSASAV